MSDFKYWELPGHPKDTCGMDHDSDPDHCITYCRASRDWLAAELASESKKREEAEARVAALEEALVRIKSGLIGRHPQGTDFKALCVTAGGIADKALTAPAPSSLLAEREARIWSEAAEMAKERSNFTEGSRYDEGYRTSLITLSALLMERAEKARNP